MEANRGQARRQFRSFPMALFAHVTRGWLGLVRQDAITTLRAVAPRAFLRPFPCFLDVPDRLRWVRVINNRPGETKALFRARPTALFQGEDVVLGQSVGELMRPELEGFDCTGV